MPEWLGLEWWRYVWQPALAGGLVWLATTWKTNADSRGARDARLDARQDRMLEEADEAIETLKAERDSLKDMADFWERNARWWFDRAHSLAHGILSARTFGALAMKRAGQEPPENWDKPVWLPALREPWAQKEPAPVVPEAPAAE